MKFLHIAVILLLGCAFDQCYGMGAGRGAITGTTYAHCEMMPSSTVEDRDGQNIYGHIDLRQVDGGMTEIRVNLTGFNTHDDNLQHGLHIHEFGDMSDGCASTGSHYNPLDVTHGAPTNSPYTRHIGDLGNIAEHAEDGSVLVMMHDYMVMLSGDYSVIGRAMVVHANPDDLGLGGDDDSLSTGNAGTRLACCDIGIADDSHW